MSDGISPLEPPPANGTAGMAYPDALALPAPSTGWPAAGGQVSPDAAPVSAVSDPLASVSDPASAPASAVAVAALAAPASDLGSAASGLTASGLTASGLTAPGLAGPAYGPIWSGATTAAAPLPPVYCTSPPYYDEEPVRRLTKRGFVIVIVIALLCGIGSYTVGDAMGTGITRTTRVNHALNQVTSVSVTPVPTLPPLTLDGADLKRYLAEAPAGAVPVPIQGSDDGVESADQFAARNFTDAEAGSFTLMVMHFQVAVVTNWLGPDGVQVVTQLAEFDTDTNARAFITDVYQGTDRDTSLKERFAILGMPDCWLYEWPAIDDAGNRRALIDCATGKLAIRMRFYLPGAFDQAAMTATLQRQIDAIAA